MSPALRSLSTRFVLAAAVFLLSLTAAVVLVVRDSLTFAGRNVAEAAAHTLQDPSSGPSLATGGGAAEPGDLAAPLDATINREINSILRSTLATIGYFTVLALIGVVLAARGLTRPIRALAEGTRAVSRGQLDVRIPVSSTDELGDLAVSFNTMAENLQVRTRELVEANEAAVENARLYEQARALATVEERQRLARELHDSVTQSLYSLTLLAEAGRRTALAGDTAQTAGLVARLGETAQQALKEMRLLVYELRPVSLEREGLAGAIRERLDAVERRAGMQAGFRSDVDGHLPQEIEHALYRIAQEALNNALKHAGAGSVAVSIRTADGAVELEVRDDGRGFDPGTNEGGLGLNGIRERASALAGEVRILSEPGRGTRVLVRVPLPETEPRL